MANTLGIASTDKLITEALRGLQGRYALLKAITIDWTSEELLPGQSAKFKRPGAVGIVDYGTALPDFTLTDGTLTMGTAKEVGVSLTATEILASNLDYLKIQAQPMTEKVANYITTEAAALITSGNFPAALEVELEDVGYRTLTSAFTALVTAKIPGPYTFRAGLVLWEALLNDAKILAAYQKSDGTNQPVQEATIGNLAGFAQVICDPFLPAGVLGFASAQEALIVKVAPVADVAAANPDAPRTYGYRLVSDGVLGYTVALLNTSSKLGVSRSMGFVIGKAVGDGRFGVRVVEAA